MNCLLDRKGKGLILGIAVLICCALIPAASFAADVDVYAEGAYTATDLVVYIYADINAGAILSFGVKVNYPAGLTYSSATKNEDVWFFGDGTTNHPYMNPENDGSGVVIIGGKLDTAAPTAGVTGSRVLLGTVTFTHSGVTDFSGVTLTYGRGDGTGDYKNFVGTDGTVYDDSGSGDGTGVDFTGITIAKLGDANLNGIFDTGDMFVVRNYIQTGKYSPIVDCNQNLIIDTGDMFCIKNKIGG